MRLTILALALTTLASAAYAQSASKPAGSEASSQSSRMARPSGNTGPANNGAGTKGSLDRNAGSATSNVAGVHGGTTPMGTDGSNTGAAGPKENDPALGGGSQNGK